jgi:hypothetical protein
MGWPLHNMARRRLGAQLECGSAMKGNLLHTLLHISDLHFGVPPASAAGGTPPTAWRHLSHADGWLGHNDSAVAQLDDYFLDLKSSEPVEPTVLVSGDLTACGKVQEFDLALNYLTRDIQLPFRIAGLRIANPIARTITGNHDQWPGSIRVVGSPTAGLRTTFPATPAFPFAPVLIPLAGKRQLSIYGIDSDANVWPWGANRLMARGHFVDQLTSLKNAIGPRKKNEIRVLLVHHSPAYDKGHTLVIRKDSLSALRGLVQQCHISVLLTGHIHRPDAAISDISYKGARWQLLEARCGTTTQTDEIPLNWVAKGTNDPNRFPANSLLVHRLYDTGRTIKWHSSLMTRTPSGFDHATPLMRSPVTVWP